MRRWCYRHPNWSLVGCFVLLLIISTGLVRNVASQNWLWAGVNLVGSILPIQGVKYWWGRT